MDGVGPYAAIDTGPIGTDAIKVGLIYNPEVVVPVGAFQVLSSADDPRFIDTKSRPALAQTFEEIATGARFTVVVNHLKSKGSDCLDVDLDPGPAVDPDNDTGDGQGNCNGTRTLAAQALVDWVATDPTGSGDPDFLIMGDLNSYAMEDPIDAIKAGADDEAGTGDDWTNLIALHQGTYAYSYVFDGQNGYLDHALANASIAGQVAGAADWHINADEPSVLDYDVSFKPEAQDRLYEADRYRTSDHDPVVVGLDLINDAPTIEVSAGTSCSTTANGGSFALTVDDNEQDVEDLVMSVGEHERRAGPERQRGLRRLGRRPHRCDHGDEQDERHRRADDRGQRRLEHDDRDDPGPRRHGRERVVHRHGRRRPARRWSGQRQPGRPRRRGRAVRRPGSRHRLRRRGERRRRGRSGRRHPLRRSGHTMSFGAARETTRSPAARVPTRSAAVPEPTRTPTSTPLPATRRTGPRTDSSSDLRVGLVPRRTERWLVRARGSLLRIGRRVDRRRRRDRRRIGVGQRRRLVVRWRLNRHGISRCIGRACAQNQPLRLNQVTATITAPAMSARAKA